MILFRETLSVNGLKASISLDSFSQAIQYMISDSLICEVDSIMSEISLSLWFSAGYSLYMYISVLIKMECRMLERVGVTCNRSKIYR